MSAAEDALGQYLAHVRVERGLRANTVAAYRRDLERYLSFLADRGVTDLGDVSPVEISEHVRELAAELKGTSVARALVSVRNLHAFAHEEKMTSENPAAEIQVPKLGKRLPKALSVAEIERLLATPDREDPIGLRDATLLELLYGTGARISEITGLDVDDATIAMADEGAGLKLRGKGGKERVVPLGSFAREVLDAYLVRARPGLAVKGDGGGALLLNTLGRRLSRNSAFTIVVIALPLLVQQIFRWSGADVCERRGLVLPTAISVALVLCIAAVWRFLYTRPALHRTVSFEWPPFQTDAQAIGVYAAFGVNDRGPAQYVLCALVFAGIVRALHRRLHWLVASWGLVGVLYVLTSSTTSTFRDVLTGFWYHDSNRLLAASPIMAVPLACLGIAWLCARARSLSSRLPQAGMGLEAVAVVLVAGLTCAGGGLTSQRALLRGESVPSQQTGLQDDEYAFLERVSQVVPQGTGVANYPYDGSAYAYSLFHVNVFFRDYDANWIGQPTSDIDTVRHDLNRAADSPATCEVLRTYDIEYALVMDRNALNGTQAPGLPFIGVDEGNWSGLTVDESTPGFELVLSDGRGNSLYRITACQG